MTVLRLAAIVALCLWTILDPGRAAARDCADSLRISDTTSLAFGTISLPKGGGGVVILDPSGPIATVGRLSAGPDSRPGIIRLCGPANTEFTLMIRAAGTSGSGTPGSLRGDLVGELELRAVAGQVRRAGDGEWLGRLGGRGVAEIHVGGSLRIPSARPGQTLSLSFDLTVLPL